MLQKKNISQILKLLLFLTNTKIQNLKIICNINLYINLFTIFFFYPKLLLNIRNEKKKKFFKRKRKSKYKYSYKLLRFLKKPKKKNKYKYKIYKNIFNKISLDSYKLLKYFNTNKNFTKLLLTKKNINYFWLWNNYKLNNNIRLKINLIKKELKYFSNFISYDINTMHNNIFLTDLINKDIENLKLRCINYKQKPYLKLKKAREAHWDFFKSATIKQRRYKNYILFLKKIKNRKYSLDILYTYLSKLFFKIKSLPRLPKNILYKYLKVDMFKKYIIIKSPLFFNYFIQSEYFNKITKKHKQRIKKWSYLRYKKYSQSWLQSRKNFPKELKLMPSNVDYFFNSSMYDVSTNSILLEKKKFFNIKTIYYYIRNNRHLRLHNFRYKPD